MSLLLFPFGPTFNLALGFTRMTYSTCARLSFNVQSAVEMESSKKCKCRRNAGETLNLSLSLASRTAEFACVPFGESR